MVMHRGGYRGSDPCAGCKRTPKEAPRYSKFDLCHQCGEFLKIGRDLKPEPSEFTAVEWNSRAAPHLTFHAWDDKGGSVDDERRRVDGPVYISDSKTTAGTSKEVAKTADALLKVLDVGTRPVRSSLTAHESDRGRIVIPKVFALAFYEFWAALSRYSRAVHTDGFNEGRNMIAGLANGSLTIEKMNDETLRMNSRGKR